MIHACRVSKASSGKIQAELHPIHKTSIPWHTVHMDITGKLSGKNDTKEYVIVLVDAFEKFVYLYHTRKIDSLNTIKALKSVIFLFGRPCRIIKDCTTSALRFARILEFGESTTIETSQTAAK